MPFTIVRQDITRMKVDAIVNAANTALAMGGGVCGAIFEAAGPEALQAACNKLAPIRTGEAVITPAFALPCRFVIHTAGPVYDARNPAESERLLRASYRNSMQIALDHKCESMAFPLISSGIYGYPKHEALQVACTEIRAFVGEHELNVSLAVFGKPEFMLSSALLGEVESYIDEHYVAEHTATRRELLNAEYEALYSRSDCLENAPPPVFSSALPPVRMAAPCNLDDLIGNLDESFSASLFRLIDTKGQKDSEVYKRANIDRKLFSKIRTGKGYTPSKRTVLALCIALELSLDETEDLLRRAGYALSPCQKSDVIVSFFITNHRYNIDELNQVLFQFDQTPLGC